MNENNLEALREQVTLLDHLFEDIDTYKREQLARVDHERQVLLRRIRELEGFHDSAGGQARGHTRDQEIIRIETVRRIVYQGPRNWVHGTLNRTLKGTIWLPGDTAADGLDRYIISQETERNGSPPDPLIKADETLEEHRKRIKDWNSHQRKHA